MDVPENMLRRAQLDGPLDLLAVAGAFILGHLAAHADVITKGERPLGGVSVCACTKHSYNLIPIAGMGMIGSRNHKSTAKVLVVVVRWDG